MEMGSIASFDMLKTLLQKHARIYRSTITLILTGYAQLSTKVDPFVRFIRTHKAYGR
jgi:hypothetical protein